MSRNDQITGPKKKTKKKTKKTASLRMNIFGVPEVISEYLDIEKKIKYTRPEKDPKTGMIRPGMPIPPKYDEDLDFPKK
jgi:hypothetical protein|tara:strand:+ start:66 stop:302 length:237 start_codon:yes stop_codon:yes gene_type:complete